MIENGPEDIEVTQESRQIPQRATAEQMQLIQAKAADLVAALETVHDGDLIGEIVTTSLKLLRDGTNRGDIKLIDKAVGELRYALKVFVPYRDKLKVSVFGSARTGSDKLDYQAAVEYGKRMAKRGWMVTTGAGGGIMEAAHGGAGRKPSFGLAIRLPFEQKTNDIIEGDSKLVHFKYFFTRKLMFVRTSNALAAFPGGFGTMDELFEVLTLVQTGKSVPMPIVLVDKKGGAFWTQWQEYVEKQLLERGLISPEDYDLYKITDDIDEAVEETCRFYHNYHSMRYVKDDVVMRLKRAPNAKQLAEITEKFSAIKVQGEFTVASAHKQEQDETEILDLPRLVFRFNRKDHGKFRQLINYLNTF
jgi:uncharacterized protein (TIGR00730 family)